MGILDRAANGVDRAISRAERTAAAFVGNDLVFDQVAALAGRTLFIVDMRFVLVTEILDGGEHGVGSGLTEAAERAVLD